MTDVLDTKAAAAYCGMALQTFKWWVWQYPDPRRRFTPDGRVGRSPYWLPSTLDRYMASRHRKPGRPKKAEKNS